jgi:hypothetical protein
MRVLDHEPRCSRRGFVTRALGAAALILSAPVGCSDDTAPAAAAVSGSFVGIVPGATTATLVSLYAAPPDGSGARQVTVYACDSRERGTIIWFVGQVTGNDFTLTSSNGEATVTGTLSAGGVTGTVSDAAVTFPFSLRPARAGEGIYTVTVAATGEYQGVSLAPGGARLEGRFSALGAAAVRAMVTVTVIADNSRQTTSEPSRNATEPGTFRAITIFDGGHFGVRGATFATTTTRSRLVGVGALIGLDLCCE